MLKQVNQLNWYGDICQQDYDLIEFVTKNNITSVNYLGDSWHLKPIIGDPSANPKLWIYLVNHSFKFSLLVKTCNEILMNMASNSFLYLSINKFLAIPEPQDKVDLDYDDAIYNYITNNIKYPLLAYFNGKEDFGKKFNWGHPLTRFYFTNACSK